LLLRTAKTKDMIIYEEKLKEDDSLIIIKSTDISGDIDYRVYYKPRWEIPIYPFMRDNINCYALAQ